MDFITTASNMANHAAKILLVLKYPSRWNELLIRTLCQRFEIYHAYSDVQIKDFGLESAITNITKKIIDENISIVIIDQEFFSLFHAGGIKAISEYAKVGLIFFDDCHNHYINRQNSCHADFVIVGPDPLEKLRYETYGITALSCALENNLVVPEHRQIAPGSPRPIDVFLLDMLINQEEESFLRP
jgi:hypothetical protein